MSNYQLQSIAPYHHNVIHNGEIIGQIKRHFFATTSAVYIVGPDGKRFGDFYDTSKDAVADLIEIAG